MDFIDKQFEDFDDDDDDDQGDDDEIDHVPKKNPNQSKLFVGTNQNGLIITIDISQILEFENNIDPDEMLKTDANFELLGPLNDKYEEEKQADLDNYNDGSVGISDTMKKLDELNKNMRDIHQKKI